MTVLPILTAEQVRMLPDRAREVVEYRKSGLSLNHVQGCPLDCAYCIRHTYGLWDQRQPRALMSDAEAVAQLVGHRYFIPHVTPLQLLIGRPIRSCRKCGSTPSRRLRTWTRGA